MIFFALGVYNIFDPAVMLGSRFYHMSNAVVGRRSTAPVVVHRGTRFEILRA